MNKISSLSQHQSVRGAITAVALVIIATLLSGCFYTTAVRDFKRVGGEAPWWCTGTPDLTESECLQFSAWMDFGVAYANQYPTLLDFQTAGGLPLASAPSNIGVPYIDPSVSGVFDPTAPNVLLYSGSAVTSRPVGVAWAITTGPGAGAPEGFSGSRDTWTEIDAVAGTWLLNLWAMRGHENHPDLFAASHPCLTSSGSNLTSTTDACFLASHTVPLEIVVANDDGIKAEGIDALVEGLYTVSGLDIKIVAPATQQSGSGDATTPGPETAQADTTMSGRLAISVNGTPADSVLYALRTMHLSPDLVMSGINEGQNLASLGSAVSGTIGAARTAVRGGVPAIASSQGVYKIPPSTENEPADYPAGVAATLVLLEQWRLGLAGMPYMELPNINIPTCLSGLSPQGTVETLVGPDLSSGAYFGIPDCVSPQATFVDDLDAYLNGYISIADMGRNEPPN